MRRRIKNSNGLALAFLAALSCLACSSGGPAARSQNQSQPAAQGPGAAQPTAQTSGPAAAGADVKIYRGTLSERGIELRLAREGGRLTGSYSYDGTGQELRLDGRAGEGGKFTLAEYDAGGRQTGKFECDAAKAGEWDQDLSCNWSKPDGGGEQFVALYEQHADFKSGLLRVAAKVTENRKFGVRASYPQLAARAGAQLPPSAAKFNRLVEQRVNDSVRRFTAGLGREKNLYFHADYNVLLATDDLVSVELSEDSYAGGAHPSYHYKAVTYDLRAGRELKLEELFKPAAGYQKAIRDLAFKQINERAGSADESAAAKQAGEPIVAEGLLGEISAWGLTPRGLMIYYELPHVIAAFQRSSVPYEAIREHLRPDGPASRYARP